MATPITFPSTTSQFSLPILFTGQAQKEFFLNQSLSIIDAILGRGIIRSTNTPPANAAEGDCFRVVSLATGEWEGHENEIAIFVGGAWHFVAPQNGMAVYDREAQTWAHYNSVWQSADAPSEPTGGTTIDSEARTAISTLVSELRKLGIFPELP